MAGSRIFGVIGGSESRPRVGYLDAAIPVTDELLRLADPASPVEVFRFASPCARSQCQHFDGHDCSLAQRTVQLVMPVVRRLPACAIRPECRWFNREGGPACVRCPQIVTETHTASEEIRRAAVAQADEGARMG